MTDEYEGLFLQAPFGYLTTDADGAIVLVNDTLLAWLGRDRDAVVGTPFTSLLDAGSRLFWETRHQPVLLLSGEVREVALTVAGAAGPLSVLVNTSVILDDAGDRAGTRIALLDTRERYEYERSLLSDTRAAESAGARLRVLQSLSTELVKNVTEQQVVDSLAESAVTAFDATAATVFLAGDDGVLRAAGGAERVPQPGGVVLRAFDEFRSITVEGIEQAAAEFPEFVDMMRAQRVEAFSAMPMSVDGPPLGVLLCTFSRARTIGAEAVELQESLARLAAEALVRVRLRAVLEVQALSDPLSGLSNRQALHDQLESDMAERVPIGVVFLDLDGFKRVNDVEGHATGDLVLAEVAQRVQDAVRAGDFCARYGGDEFVILCRDADADAAGDVADRVRAAIAEPLAATASVITASVGVAVVDPRARAYTDDVLNDADAAMYRSKQAGGNRVTIVVA